jgi:hypothetical protein
VIENPSESRILFNPGCASRIPAVALTLAGAKRAMRIVSAVAVFQHVATDSGVDPKRVNRAANQFRSARRPAVVMRKGKLPRTNERFGCRLRARPRGRDQIGTR